MEIIKETEKILNHSWEHGHHEVTWRLHTSKNKIRVTDRLDIRNMNTGKYHSSICYSGLKHPITAKFYSHLTTVIPIDEKTRKVLTKKEMIDWLILSKKHKMLPHYVAPTKIVTKKDLNVTFKLRSVVNMQQLYVYLATVRYTKEDPGFVKIMLHLVNNLKMDYFLAICVSTYHAAPQKGHNILPMSAGYPVSEKVDIHKYDVTLAKALKLFINNPKKYNKYKILQDDSWNMHGMLENIKVGDRLTLAFKELDNKNIKKHLTVEEK